MMPYKGVPHRPGWSGDDRRARARRDGASDWVAERPRGDRRIGGAAMSGEPPEGRVWFRSRSGLVLLAFLGMAGFFLVTEHTAHVLGVLPYLLFLACPLLHFLHGGRGGGHGGHGGHGPHGDDGPGRREGRE